MTHCEEMDIEASQFTKEQIIGAAVRFPCAGPCADETV